MDAQLNKIIIAVVVVAVLIIITTAIYLLRMARRGNKIGALMGLIGFLAGVMYEMNRWVSYALLGMIVVLVIFEINKIMRE